MAPRSTADRLEDSVDLEERTLEETLEQTCAVCGAPLTAREIEEAREDGGPFLCHAHAAEDLAVDTDPEQSGP
jgi:hypothetical protein